MKNNKKYTFGLSLINVIGPARFEKIKKYFNNNLDYAWKNLNLENLKKAGLEEKLSFKIIEEKNKINLEKEWIKLKQENITIITKEDKNYPKRLKEIKLSPFILFCKGNTDLLEKNQLAVVGSRKISPYGEQVIEKIITEATQAGLVITSGMAFGVDALSQKTTIQKGASTIAVLGHGIGENTLRYSVNYELSKEIRSKNGLLLSEYPPNFPANKFTFPARNRIISGLSLGTLIIEADIKSGSLITARHALEQNRDVFAIPGNIFSPQSKGTNSLLKQGAKVVTSIEDILEAFNFISLPNYSNKKKEITFNDPLEEKIYQKLSCEPLHLDQIALLCNLDAISISTKLSMMELGGLTKNIGGSRFIRC